MKLIQKGSMFSVLLICVSVLACTQSEVVSADAATQQFFDLKGYFNAEAQRLTAEGIRQATKVVVADGKTESRNIDNIDYERELSFFAASDNNRPAWTDKYVVDTLFNELNQVVQLNYKCIDDKLKIRNIVVDFDGIDVNKIFIENNTSNSIATSSQNLVYQPAIGYSIESHQKVAIGDEQLFKVSVKF
ncbi:MAG: hypothetical protein K9J37_15485 [Saprospiraceae bacterium]|nr:hypothetical protein [Saprospiraceae bacterium]MCF8251313.1 hypothetical protein [Saprospiraceae bacterium]MCF8280614.1 hypothetical protein [Bacteroidales bacterium]MCF8313188.1 hypothetical protein [Saprospiraceae bacterium]MCF8441648.1 hypothetical protein [Saprospiraceae bacterium]